MVPETTDRRPSRRTVLEGIATAAALAGIGGVGSAAAAGTDRSTGPGSGWPSYRGGDGNTGYAPDSSGPREGYETRWSVDPEPDRDLAFRHPAVVDDLVFVGGKHLHALEAPSGEKCWTFSTDASTRAENRFHGVAVEDGTVYAGTGWLGSAKGKVYAVDVESGTEQWRYTAPPVEHDETGDYGTFHNLTVADGVVLAPMNTQSADDDELYALDAESGELLWSLKYGDEATTGSRTAPPAAVEDGTVFVKTSGALVAVDVGTGETQWRQPAEEGFYTKTAAPVVADGTVYASESPYANSGSSLFAVSAEDGSVEWTYTPDLSGQRWSTPVVGPDAVYVHYAAGADSYTYALSRGDGSLQWRRSEGHVAPRALTDGVLYTEASAVEASDGAKLFEYPASDADPAVAADALFLGSEEVLALDPSSSGEPSDPPADPGGSLPDEPPVSTAELREVIQMWVDGEATTDELIRVVKAWART